jgi:S1-C subfamily serine protease
MMITLTRFVAAASLFSICQVASLEAKPAEKSVLSATNADSSVIAPSQQVSNAVENSVVKVFATVRYPDFYKPWTKQEPAELTASGVVIEGKRILSNAHVVLYASQVQIQANQAGDKLSAMVEAGAPGIDLAVLKLDDETFFDTHPPLPRARALPEIKDAVMAYGYPKGGSSLSITKGIVSRIEFASYNLFTSGLRVQIDAAINPGNSGGPAVVGDKMIGLAFSHLASSESIGYIIPCEEIDLFLADIADGHYDGKPSMADDLQTLENAALRPFLKLNRTVQGIVIHRPASDDPDYPLKEWDVITKIGDTPVDDEGMVKLGGNLRVYFSYMVQKIAAHGKVPLTIVRAGKEIHVDLPVESRHPQVIPSLEGAYPPYFIYGPLVFSTATLEFIANFATSNNRRWMAATGSPLLLRLGDKPAFDGERLVIVSSPFFPHELSKGYVTPLGDVVKTVNGIPIKNLGHLVEVLRDSKDEFIRIEFAQRHGETLVFPRAKMVAATDDILNDNGVRSQGSPDTLAIWNMAKPVK